MQKIEKKKKKRNERENQFKAALLFKKFLRTENM